MLTIENVDRNKYNVIFTSSSKLLGTFRKHEDGYFYFWEDISLTGSWNAYGLRVIAEELDKLNLPFEDIECKDFKTNEKEKYAVYFAKWLLENTYMDGMSCYKIFDYTTENNPFKIEEFLELFKKDNQEMQDWNEQMNIRPF